MACKEYLHDTLIYTCLPCKVFLHESCINEMLRQVQSSFHPQHSLLRRAIRKGSQRCNACGEKVTGIIFYCYECDVILHVSCAKYQTRAMKHDCHPHHLLQLGKSIINRISSSFYRRDCSDSSFSCKMCNFNIHLTCIPLSSYVKHSRHMHSLVFKNSFVEDDSGEYYCDMCEI